MISLPYNRCAQYEMRMPRRDSNGTCATCGRENMALPNKSNNNLISRVLYNLGLGTQESNSDVLMLALKLSQNSS